MLSMMQASRLRLWLVALGILLVVLAAWGVTRKHASPQHAVPSAVFHQKGYPIANLPAKAKNLTYVATFPMDGYGMDVLPTKAGFLTREGDYIMHDWRDGHKLWKVSPPNEKGWGQPDGPWIEVDNGGFALSDDGRYFAASTVQANGVRVQRWRDGKAYGDFMVLPSRGGKPKPSYYKLNISDSGMMFLQYFADQPNARDDDDRFNAPQCLLVMDGHHVIARANMPKNLWVLPGGALAYSSAGGILYTVKVQAGRVRFRRIARKVPYFTQYPGNYLLAGNGAVYTPAGRISPPNAKHKANDIDDHSYQCGCWDWLIFSDGKSPLDIFSLTTRAHWSLKAKPAQQGEAVSADGRYVLLHDDEDNQDPQQPDTDSIWLYERPGVLRAALRYDPEIAVPFGTYPNDDRIMGEGCYRWLLSPDGKSVILKYQYMGIDGEALLYRW